jgi:hypothetical protein
MIVPESCLVSLGKMSFFIIWRIRKKNTAAKKPASINGVETFVAISKILSIITVLLYRWLYTLAEFGHHAAPFKK